MDKVLRKWRTTVRRHLQSSLSKKVDLSYREKDWCKGYAAEGNWVKTPQTSRCVFKQMILIVGKLTL